MSLKGEILNSEYLGPQESNESKVSPPFFKLQESNKQIHNIREQEKWDRVFESYEKYEGIDNFKKIFLSLSQEKKDFLYTLIQEGKLKKYIDETLGGQMHPDKETLDDFLLEELKLVENNIINIDLRGKDLQYLNLLVYQIEELITRNSSNKEALIKKLYDIKLMRSELKKKQQKEVSEGLLGLNQDKQSIGTEIKSIGTEIKSIGTEIKSIGTEIKSIGTEIKSIGTEIKIDKQNIKSFIEYIKQQKFGKNTKISLFINKLEKGIQEQNIEKIKLLNQELFTFLNQGQNLKDILKESKGKSKEAYKKVYTFVESLARQSPNSFESQEILVKLHQFEAENPFDKEALPNKSTIYEAQAKAFFGADEAKKDGEQYINGDKMLDFSAMPPRAYILGADGEYKLETDLPQLPNTEDILSKRRELQEIRFKLQEDQKQKNDFIQKYGQEYNSLFSKTDKTPEEQKRLDELKNIIDSIQEEITKLVKRAKELRKALLNTDFDPKEKVKLTEKQQKQEKTLSLLHSTGFDSIPQSITDKVIEEVNFSKRGIIDLGGGKKLQENINIKEGKFGNGMLENEEEIFIRFFNKMISGSPTEPLNIENYKNKEKNPEQFTREQILQEFKKGGILDINGDYKFQKMMDNLSKPLGGEGK
ncbi:hypothetical protein HGA92_00335 [Candidatus Gracilibacteria bacterium]|nr:hypothetical protein [Candidatus Gracilibacteria bacterium]NUJ98941.1 hypothetical protein [Candidatus Gracilibacteria bacterium]